MFSFVNNYTCIFLLIHFKCALSSKSALDTFVSKKYIGNFTITTLTENNISWIEYHYKFYSYKASNIENLVLKVGVYDHTFNSNNKPFFPASFCNEILNILSNTLYFQIEYILVNLSNPITMDNFVDIDMLMCHSYNIKHNIKITELSAGLKSKFALLYKTSNVGNTTDIFILTFVGTLWFCFLITLIAMSICLRYSTSKYSIIYINEKRWSWVEITLWAIAAACQQGISYAPNYFASRCLFLFGYLTAYLLYTGFTAAITSILVRQEEIFLDTTNNNLIVYSFGTKYYNNINIHQELFSIKELFEKLEIKNVIALGPEVLLKSYIEDQKYTKLYKIVPIVGTIYNKGFLLPMNSIWLKPLYQQLLKLDESGIINNVLSKYVNEKSLYIPFHTYSSASLNHVGSALYVYLSGLLVSLISLILECILFKFKLYKYKKNKQTTESNEQKHLNTVI